MFSHSISPSIPSYPVIFCCDDTERTDDSVASKLYQDPNRELHHAILQSFVEYARRQCQHFSGQDFSGKDFGGKSQGAKIFSAKDFSGNDFNGNEIKGKVISGNDEAALRAQAFLDSLESSLLGYATRPPPPSALPPPHPLTPAPVLTAEALANNPITPDTLYVIHIQCREDFGPVYSHRYFACPMDLKDDWTEITHVQWFAEGYPFRMRAEKWDFKCENDRSFFRLSLRPNLNKRGPSAMVIGGVSQNIEVNCSQQRALHPENSYSCQQPTVSQKRFETPTVAKTLPNMGYEWNMPGGHDWEMRSKPFEHPQNDTMTSRVPRSLLEDLQNLQPSSLYTGDNDLFSHLHLTRNLLEDLRNLQPNELEDFRGVQEVDLENDTIGVI